jgi:hypothetical protein
VFVTATVWTALGPPKKKLGKIRVVSLGAIGDTPLPETVMLCG